uniref:Uncharacterized protein n=1 Tax=Plectus sambesii TaxID=2011161 RepID=A0A914XDW2_9BILA
MPIGLVAHLALALGLFVMIKAEGNATGCPIIRLNEVLGTKKYILYGLTADCQLFFASGIPDGIDLGKQFGPKPKSFSFDSKVDCKSARLYPIRNVNNELKMLLVFMAGPQIYARAFDFKVPDKDNWFSLITGPDNGPLISQCTGETNCSYTNFTSLIDVPVQAPDDHLLAFVPKSGNQFALFYRISLSQTQKDMNVYTMAANDTLNRTETIINILLKTVNAVIMDPYSSNIYLFDDNLMYQYPLNQMNNFSDLSNYESKDRVSIFYDIHSYNYYVVNNIFFRLQFASSNQANITILTIPALLNTTTQYTVMNIPTTCIGQLVRPNNQDYNSLENFQMSALFHHDYDEVVRSAQSGINVIHSLKFLLIFALAVFYYV